MKERNFYSDEFEELIREKTDQYKMYPSDKVWKGVYSFLHTKRRRYIIGMSMLVTGILFFAGKELLGPSKPDNAFTSPVATAGSSNPDTVLSVSPAAFATFQKENEPPGSSPVTLAHISNPTLAAVAAPDMMDPARQMGLNESIVSSPDIYTNESTSPEPQTAALIVSMTTAVQTAEPVNGTSPIALSANSTVEMNPLLAGADPKQVAMMNAMAQENKQLKWLKENASYELTSISKRNKLRWEVYATPTFNYRKLATNGDFYVKTNTQTGPVAIDHSGDPNGYVDQKPAVGLQLGGSIVYRLTRNLSLKAGLQFDYSRYLINAYATSTEPTIISLNSFNGYSYNTITSYTDIRNFGGTSPKQIQNRYYQLSMPIGLEMRVMGNKKLQLNIAGTIQPTYLFNRDIYMLTTDYTNYTKEPSLIRRWNINGGVEAFLSYDMGAFRLQVGPQFRYQFLSTYSNQFPLKENLMQYGIKIGISKTIR